jgi:hypothetical protein
MRTITSRNEIALQFYLLLLMRKANKRLRGCDIKQLDILDTKQNGATLREASRDAILQYFMLRVNHDGATTGQFIEVYAMALSIKAQFDAVMNKANTIHTLAEAQFIHQIDRSLLKNACANGRFDIFSAPAFQYNGVNAVPRQ